VSTIPFGYVSIFGETETCVPNRLEGGVSLRRPHSRSWDPKNQAPVSRLPGSNLEGASRLEPDFGQVMSPGAESLAQACRGGPLDTNNDLGCAAPASVRSRSS
jgi:hypothetical protein